MGKNGVQHALSALWRGLSIVQFSAGKKNMRCAVVCCLKRVLFP